MMIRNYAKQPLGLFTRTAAKVAALTVLQYVNYGNHRQIGQVKYALIYSSNGLCIFCRHHQIIEEKLQCKAPYCSHLSIGDGIGSINAPVGEVGDCLELIFNGIGKVAHTLIPGTVALLTLASSTAEFTYTGVVAKCAFGQLAVDVMLPVVAIKALPRAMAALLGSSHPIAST